eukprot:113930_1
MIPTPRSTNLFQEYLSMIGPSIGWMGVQIAWSLQKGYGTTVLFKLHLRKSIVNFIWLAGPISGIIVQPLIGSCSDKCNTRRPFIIIGCITIMINLWIFSNTQNLFHAIYIFWLNDFCINILMVPLRALSTDNLPSKRQMDSMSYFSICGSIGSSAIFLISSYSNNISLSYSIGSTMIFITTIITLAIDILYSNKNNKRKTINNNKNSYFICRICVTIWSLPLYIWKIMHAQFWSFAAFYSFWIYLPTFYSENIMQGKINEDMESWTYIQYQKGITYSNFGYCWNSIIMVITSFLIPKVFGSKENKIYLKIFWIMSYLLCGCFLCITPWINNEYYLYLFVILHALCGITSACMEIFPWQMTSSYTTDYNPDNKALILTIVNLAVCSSQILVAMIAGYVIQYFDGNLASILFLAGICKCIAAICVYFIDLEYKEKQSFD